MIWSSLVALRSFLNVPNNINTSAFGVAGSDRHHHTVRTLLAGHTSKHPGNSRHVGVRKCVRRSCWQRNTHADLMNSMTNDAPAGTCAARRTLNPICGETPPAVMLSRGRAAADGATARVWVDAVQVSGMPN